MPIDSAPSLKPFLLSKQKAFLDPSLSTSFEASAIADPAVLASLAANQPFPAGDIRLGNFRLKASTSAPITFKTLGGPLSFKASAASFGAFALYGSSTTLQDDLKKGPLAKLPQLALADLADGRYALLSFGYDVAASASGAAALGPVSIKSNINAQSDAFFGAITAIAPNQPSRDAIDQAAAAFIPPSLIREPSQLPPRTWVLAEVEASLGVTVGAQLGLDFNWIREAQLEGLSGDIGLRLQTAISANIGFRSSGRWLAIVSRESDRFTLRLQLYRLSESGLNIAFDAGATFKANLAILPPSSDDFIKAILGVHGAQVLKDLKLLDKWTDPKTKLADLLASEALDAAGPLIAHLGGVTLDQVQQHAEQVRTRLLALLKAWHTLPHRVSAQVLVLVSDHTPLDTLRSFLTRVTTSATPEELQQLLEDQLAETQFFSTPIGRWVESATGSSALALLAQPLAQVQLLATQTLALLDGGIVEETLTRLLSFLNQQLSIDQLGQLVTQADFNKLDPFLKSKLATFLGQPNPSMVKVEEVRQTLGLLIRKRQEFYNKAVQALKRNYSASIAASFSSATTSTAQIDATFDFSGNPPGLAEALQAALRGDLDTLLTQPQPGISLNMGKLTHGIQRRTNIEITLPFAKSSFTHLNQSLASLEAMESDGRVLVYGLDSSDSAVSNHRNSTLTLGLHIATLPATKGLNVHEPPTLSLSYSLRQYLPRLDQSDVLHQLLPLIHTYFPGKVKPAELNRYLDSLNARTEALIPNTPDFYGDALFSLETTFNSTQSQAMGALWLGLGKKQSDKAYQEMSIRIQKALKQIVVDTYFQSPNRYLDLLPAQVLLAWAAIPASNANEKTLHWDWPDLEKRKALLAGNPETVNNFKRLLTLASDRLNANPAFSGTAKFYQPKDAARILASVPVSDPRLHGLLFAEATTIEAIYQAGKKISEFSSKAATQPSKAVKLLAEFGSKMTETFNNGSASLYLGPISRALGTALYVEALRGLSLDQLQFQPAAFARLAVIRPNFQFEPKDFIASGSFPDDNLILNDQLTS